MENAITGWMLVEKEEIVWFGNLKAVGDNYVVLHDARQILSDSSAYLIGTGDGDIDAVGRIVGSAAVYNMDSIVSPSKFVVYEILERTLPDLEFCSDR